MSPWAALVLQFPIEPLKTRAAVPNLCGSQEALTAAVSSTLLWPLKVWQQLPSGASLNTAMA